MCKRVLALLLSASLSLSLLTSCKKDKTFSYLEFSLILPESFEVIDSDDYDLAISDGEASVGILRISLDNSVYHGIPNTYSPRDLALHALAESGSDATVHTYSSTPYYTIYKTVGGREYYTLFTFYKSIYAYFVAVYAVPRAKEEARREELLGYTERVFFTS